MAKRQKLYRASPIYLSSGLSEYGDPDRRYFTGAVPTLHGYVNVYAEARYANWRFISGGKTHELTVRGTLTARGLITIARRFASDVVNGEVDA